jgi:hypothetical protein
VCVTHTLAGEYVGLEEVDDGLWDVYFGPIKLGRMDERILRIEEHKGRTVRKPVLPMTRTDLSPILPTVHVESGKAARHFGASDAWYATSIHRPPSCA